ncbi:MAG: RtcB family protein [Clostridiales bacterium]|nr:RtcB family protein [Clostridiales bacterium]
MITIKGKHNEAKIFTDVVDEGSIAQIQTMCDSPIFAQSKIRIMPDVHAGAGCTIGTTMTITDKVVPNMVGVDIGCGMELIRLEQNELDLDALDKLIYARIPSGFNYRDNHHEYTEQIDLTELRCVKKVDIDLAYVSLGTLGGGNHFIEADKDEEGNIYIVVHSGSRHLGLEVAEYYQKEGYRRLCGNSQSQLQELIKQLKAEGRAKEIEKVVRDAKQKTAEIPEALAYVEGSLFDDYIHDMRIVQRFAVLNRQAMTDEIVRGLKLSVAEQFTTIHNYIDTDNMILRKGAVSAKKGEKLLIPINMRDGSLICIGKGNDDWNESAPHGAGRILSRGKARATLTMEQFEREMSGIFSTSINASTLDESPMAYKNMDDIVNNITPTADIVKRIVPIYNFKASEEVSFGKNRK